MRQTYGTGQAFVVDGRGLPAQAVDPNGFPLTQAKPTMSLRSRDHSPGWFGSHFALSAKERSNANEGRWTRMHAGCMRLNDLPGLVASCPFPMRPDTFHVANGCDPLHLRASASIPLHLR
jgi:hypothetical protein